MVMLMMSSYSYAISVNKMLIIPNDNEQHSTITVTNSDKFPTFLNITLSELLEDNTLKKFDLEKFSEWPVYTERSKYLIDAEENLTINVYNLIRKQDYRLSKDKIIAIDIMPESIVEGDSAEAKMNVLIGYRVWMILSKDGDITGKTKVMKEGDNFYYVNETNTVSLFNVDACDTNFTDDVSCKYSDFVLSGKKKKLNLSSFKNGKVSVSSRDAYRRYNEIHEINLQ